MYGVCKNGMARNCNVKTPIGHDWSLMNANIALVLQELDFRDSRNTSIVPSLPAGLSFGLF